MSTKYPNVIMDFVRQRLGLEEGDTLKDGEINAMSQNEVFDACLVWEGIIGYGPTFRRWIKNIYNVDLDHPPAGFKGY